MKENFPFPVVSFSGQNAGQLAVLQMQIFFAWIYVNKIESFTVLLSDLMEFQTLDRKKKSALYIYHIVFP